MSKKHMSKGISTQYLKKYLREARTLHGGVPKMKSPKCGVKKKPNEGLVLNAIDETVSY